jgi:starch phosphorylase
VPGPLGGTGAGWAVSSARHHGQDQQLRDGIVIDTTTRRFNGAADQARVARDLRARLPAGLTPLAEVACNYRWSWEPDGPGVFRDIDADLWEASDNNPVAILRDAPALRLEAAAANPRLVRRVEALAQAVAADLARPGRAIEGVTGPIAFLCAEFAVHRSLPIYSGGLGALAGDLLKEASDQALDLVGVGLLYREGYFRQRLEMDGWQREYWQRVIPGRLPAALVTGADGRPLTVDVPLAGRQVVLQIWRVDVGRVPLFLLDADLPANRRTDRWTTARLYIGDRIVRLRQYALLGIGAVRALAAMGYSPALLHLNEGHAALAPLELAHRLNGGGLTPDEAIETARLRTVFTTHTPVPAGNETYDAAELRALLPDSRSVLGIELESLLALGRINPDDGAQPLGLTPLGIRLSRATNGVSRRHGEVARRMWNDLYPERRVEDVPVGHVTNGVHLPTWMGGPMRALLDAHLGERWTERTGDPGLGELIDAIPDDQVWEARCAARAALVQHLRDRSIVERLRRGEPAAYAESAAEVFDAQRLTVGFARRIATYKRLHLLTADMQAAQRILSGTGSPRLQLVVAGKAHPMDDEAKRLVQGLFRFKDAAEFRGAVIFLEDYDLGTAARLVSGCDLWVNLPRPPLEASGTSGMKAALNGAIHLGTLDGWWAEAWDGSDGWALPEHEGLDPYSEDASDASALYSLLENEVMPLFEERDAEGVPRGWVRMVKASLRTAIRDYTATRMLNDYVARVYRQ